LSKPGTVTVQIKVKHLWLVLGVVLALLALSPVVASYLPATTVSSTSPGSGTSGSGGSSTGSSQITCPNPCNIYIENSIFGFNVSQTLYVAAGTTVTWHNIDDTDHTSTSDTGIWNSGVIPVGSTFSYTFKTPGTYPYHCLIHPMQGTIVVVS
jgi:plastocyanin